jgi:predicted alpha/beta-fold hydrolase
MPFLISNSYNETPFMLLNGHLETIIPSLFHKAPMVNYQRQRLELKDGDFIDLKEIQNGITYAELPNIFMILDGMSWLGIVAPVVVKSIGCLSFTIMVIPMT